MLFHRDFMKLPPVRGTGKNPLKPCPCNDSFLGTPTPLCHPTCNFFPMSRIPQKSLILFMPALALLNLRFLSSMVNGKGCVDLFRCAFQGFVCMCHQPSCLPTPAVGLAHFPQFNSDLLLPARSHLPRGPLQERATARHHRAARRHAHPAPLSRPRPGGHFEKVPPRM